MDNIDIIYEYLVNVANKLFDLNITRVIDNLIDIIRLLFARLWRIFGYFILHLNVRQYVDAKKLESDLDIKLDYQELSIWGYWRKIVRGFYAVSEYIPFTPILIEASFLILSESRLLRLWLMSGFLITFVCIWGIIATKPVVSQMICRIMGLRVETFDLDIFLKVGGLFMISIGSVYLVWAMWYLDLITSLVCLTVINRLYRNIRSYLTVIRLEESTN